MENFNLGGHIQVIMGPMFSGKTTELLHRIRLHNIANKKCLLIKYKGDDRYSEDKMTTHDKNHHNAVSCETLSEAEKYFSTHDVIGIDEGQFFSDISEVTDRLASIGKTVIISCLDGTFERKPFSCISDLIPKSEIITKLHAICMKCYESASFSKRIGDEKEIKIIGGKDKYMALCRNCYNQKK